MKKILSLFLVVSLLFFSGCRTKLDGTDVSETEGSEKEERVTLQFWNIFDSEEVFRGQIQEYKSKYPQVNIQYKKFVNIEEYERLLIEEVAQGEGPDIFAVHNSWITKYQKMITPLPVGKTSMPLTPDIFRQTFFAAAVDDLILQDAIYGVPLFIDSLALYYNTSLFRDGIANADKPAELWSEIKEQVFMLTKPNKSVERFAVSGISLGRADNISRAIDLLYMLFLQHDATMYDDAKEKATFSLQQGTLEGTGRPAFPAAAALELYTSFARPSFKNYSWNDTITSYDPQLKELAAFMKGKVAMIFGYSYLYDQLLDIGKGLSKEGATVLTEKEIGIVPVPQLQPFSETGQRDTFASYFPLVVSRNTEHEDVAWDFIQFLATKESLTDYHDRTHKPTSRKDMVEDQMIEPKFGVFARQAGYAKSYAIFDTNAYEKIFSQAIDRVVKNKADAKQALLLAQKQVQCLIDKKKEKKHLDVDCTMLR